MASWDIVVVDTNPKRWPPAKQLMMIGVSMRVVVAWQKVRRRMSPAGLRRWAWEHRN